MVLPYHTVWYANIMEVEMSRENNVRTIWLEEGLKILAEKGPAKISIENLTKRHRKDKGVFLSSFQQPRKYIEQLLEYYEKTGVDEIIEVVSREDNPREQLKKLTKLTFQISSEVELIIRAWALYDPVVKRYQDHIDRRRLKHVRNLHINSGLKADKAEILSYRDYSLFLGLQQLRHHFTNTQLRSILKEIYAV